MLNAVEGDDGVDEGAHARGDEHLLHGDDPVRAHVLVPADTDLSTFIKPIVLEKDEYMGGISRTVRYKGNRIDIGGHRFYSKSDEVNRLWREMLPDQFIDLTRHRPGTFFGETLAR